MTTVDAYLPAGRQAGPSRSAPMPSSTGWSSSRRWARDRRSPRGWDQRSRAAVVILAAGTYGSPAILLRSGIGPADQLRELGVAVLASSLPGVGNNLADHPGVDLDAGWRGEVGVAAGRPPLRSPRCTARRRRCDGAPDLMFSAERPRRGSEPGLLPRPDPPQATIARVGAARSTDPTDWAESSCRTSTSHRMWTGSSRATSGDWSSRTTPRSVGGSCTERAPAAPGSVAAAWRELILANAYSIPHVVGTCAMGSSPADGAVVDAGGQVRHGTAGLFVADASIMPEPPDGFPHVVALMIAEHLSDRLAGPVATRRRARRTPARCPPPGPGSSRRPCRGSSTCRRRTARSRSRRSCPGGPGMYSAASRTRSRTSSGVSTRGSIGATTPTKIR